MTPEDFKLYWEQQYPKSAPIGSWLIGAYRERWLRIHTLPDSKRYPETKQEYAEVLKRHNTVLSDLLGGNNRYALVTTGYSPSPEPVRSYPELESLAGDSQAAFSVPMPDEVPNYWHFFVGERIWGDRSVDDLLLLIADDVVRDVLFVGIDRSAIYQPYDGGGDIIAPSRHMRNSLRIKYSAWLSKHPGGL